MRRFFVIIWHGFSICLLLLAAAIAGANVGNPLLLDEKEHNNNSQEEQSTKEAVIHRTRHQRFETQQAWLLGISSSPRSLRMRDAQWLGQLCFSDGLKGEHQARNGCGAVLLR